MYVRILSTHSYRRFQDHHYLERAQYLELKSSFVQAPSSCKLSGLFVWFEISRRSYLQYKRQMGSKTHYYCLLHKKKHPWKEGKSTAAPCAVMSMSGTLKANRMTMSARSAVSLKKPLSLKNRQSQSRESYKKKRALRFFASGRRTALTEPE